MKKRLSIAIVATLCTVTGMAGEAAQTPPSPRPAAPSHVTEDAQASAFSEADAPYDGVWQPFEDGFGLYLPRGWSNLALTEPQAEAGLFYASGSGDGAMGVAVGYMRAGGLETADDLAGDFEAAGYSGVMRRDLNGIPAIGFERPQDDYRGVAFFHPIYPDYVLYVYVSPLGLQDAEAKEIGEAILASVSPMVDSSDGLKNY